MADNERSPLLGSPPLPRRSAREAEDPVRTRNMQLFWVPALLSIQILCSLSVPKEDLSLTFFLQPGTGMLALMKGVGLCFTLFVIAIIAATAAVLLSAHQVANPQKFFPFKRNVSS